MGGVDSACFNKTGKTLSTNSFTQPLRLGVYSMSKSGNLTMVFNRPFEVPELFIDSIISQQRNLDEDMLKASDFMELFVLSSVHDDESSAMRIDDYHLTRFTEMAFDI